jgi:hypothetical protein
MNLRCPSAVPLRVTALVVLCLLMMPASEAQVGTSAPSSSLWAHDNLVAWEVIPYDALKRSPEERAKMLARLGIRHYAYLDMGQQPKQPRELRLYVDAEIEAMQKYNIDVLAWYYWIDVDDPAQDPEVRLTLESFKRHHIHPQLWVSQSQAHYPKTSKGWAKYFPPGIKIPATTEEYNNLSGAEKHVVDTALIKAEEQVDHFPGSPREYQRRVELEADRIRAFVRLAAPYGCQVHIYNHTLWFGMVENQVAILERLQRMGVQGVGMVYNFSHARDLLHDDSKDFARLWNEMKSHVVELNVTAIEVDTGVVDYPSQGDRDLEMVRVIQQSGWRGPVGILVQRHEDAEVALRNDMSGVDWLAAEINEPGSGGPRPFPLLESSR